MSDIRKDFEAWAGDRYTMSIFGTDYAWEGYQAGRAHDIEGLIAEIEEYTNLDGTISVHNLMVVLRKHFGKE